MANIPSSLHKTSTQEVIDRVKDYDHLFKLIIIGNSGVGKTCLMSRFVGETFTPSYITTIGVDFKLKTVLTDGTRLKLQLWDTAGQERFRTIVSCYYRGAHGVMVVYDVQSYQSFNDVKLWLYEIAQYCDKKEVQKILIGNKCDDPLSRAVPEREAQKLADSLQIPYIETSAKDGTRVEEAFTQLAEMILEIRNGRFSVVEPEKTKLNVKDENKKNNNCC